jgi:cellulose synthase/poly-beta-1,6-N-acetylglucosamine synthase-like glycosyltransferase
MMSCLVWVERDADALGATLGALVPAAADGFLSDVIVISSPDKEGVAELTEATGAVLVSVPAARSKNHIIWRAGAEAARRDWLLCLKAGDVPEPDWPSTAGRFINLADQDHEAWALMGCAPHSFLRTLRWLIKPKALPDSGALIRKAKILSSPPLIFARPAMLKNSLERFSI